MDLRCPARDILIGLDSSFDSPDAPGPTRARPKNHRGHTVAWFAVKGSALVVTGLTTAVYFAGPLPFAGPSEDSPMYARYAGGLLRHSGMARNPHGPTTYGLTARYLRSVILPLDTHASGCPIFKNEYRSLPGQDGLGVTRQGDSKYYPTLLTALAASRSDRE